MATHGRKVYTLAVYLLANREEAEDVTQEVLIRLWRRGHEVVPEKIGPWLVRVTLHRGRRRLREELKEVHDHVAAC